ncbi:hypothetical protein [Acinetobacter beijerinckii]
MSTKQFFDAAREIAGGKLTRLVMYDRKLTSDEIAKISSSWL